MIIVDEATGRIGNTFMEAVNVLAFAMETGQTVINATLAPYARYLSFFRNNLFCSYPSKIPLLISEDVSEKWMIRGKAERYLRRVMTRLGKLFQIETDFRRYPLIRLINNGVIKKYPNILLTGWLFDCPELVEKHAETIRPLFQPVGSVVDAIDNPISQLRRESDIVFGLAIRQGDYARFENGKYYFDLASYRSLIVALADLFPNKKVGFFIASEEKQPEDAFRGIPNYLRSGHPVENIFTLSKCDYIVTVPSSFAHWAAFYGKSPVYYIEDIHKKPLLSDFKRNQDLYWPLVREPLPESSCLNI